MQRLASLALLLLMAVVVLASAWLRLNAPHAACDSWPQCRLEQRVDALSPAPHEATDGVRFTHRVAASAALLLIVVMGVPAWRRRQRTASRLLAVLLALALGLSALGVVTPGSRAAAVMLGNLLGGSLMFALAWALWRTLRDGAALPAPLARAACGVALLWLAQAAFGALSGAVAGAGAGAVATPAHLLLALPLAIAAFLLASALRRARRRRESLALLALLALQLLLGVAAGFGAAAPVLVLAHNTGAALGLALLLGWATHRRDPRPGG
jgi:cytochrome c oxidase assembly protein subunit 15